MLNPSSPRPALLLPYLVALAALATVALASPGCGGNVVVDGRPTGGSGGSAGTVGSGGSAGTAGTAGGGGSGGTAGTAGTSVGGAGGAGGFVGAGEGGAGGSSGGCMVVPMPPYSVVLACAVGAICPAPDTLDAQTLVTHALGLCDTTKSTCCGGDVLVGIRCALSPSDGSCCYVTLTEERTCL